MIRFLGTREADTMTFMAVEGVLGAYVAVLLLHVLSALAHVHSAPSPPHASPNVCMLLVVVVGCTGMGIVYFISIL